MKQAICFIVLTIGLTIPTPVGAEPNSAGDPKGYVIAWDFDATKAIPSKVVKTAGGQLREILIPAPADLPYQKVQWELLGVVSHRVVNTEEGRIIIVRVAGSRFRLRVHVEPRLSEIPKLAKPVTMPRDARACLLGNKQFAGKNPRTARLAQELRAETATQTVRAILNWIKNNMHYRYDPALKWREANAIGSTDAILTARLGDCGAHSELFVGLCRQSGVPARMLWGPVKIAGLGPPPADSGLPQNFNELGDFSGHAWAEVYLEGWGWLPLEPQHPETILGQVPKDYVPFLRLGPGVADLRPEVGLALSNVVLMNYFPRLEKSDRNVSTRGKHR